MHKLLGPVSILLRQGWKFCNIPKETTRFSVSLGRWIATLLAAICVRYKPSECISFVRSSWPDVSSETFGGE